MAVKLVAVIVWFSPLVLESIAELKDEDIKLFLSSEKSFYSGSGDIKSQCDSFFKIICSTKNWERVNCTVDVAKSAEKLCTGISVAFHHKRYIVDTYKKVYQCAHCTKVLFVFYLHHLFATF